MTYAGNKPTPSILVLNGPNLNLLGQREPALYGSKTLADVHADLLAAAQHSGTTIDFRQSNNEGVLIDAVQEAMTDFDGVIINPGGLSHSSVSLRDALAMLSVPVVEVHITNILAREKFRHHSYISGIATAVIVGAGTGGYELALAHLLKLLSVQTTDPMPASRAASVLMLSGPNLNFLGLREPKIYGHDTLADIEQQANIKADHLDLNLDLRQSNSEAVLIEAAQEAMSHFDALVINPAGLTFTSVALRDALAMLQVPVIELHISNVMAREEYLHHSLISPIATAIIMGAGVNGYLLALDHVSRLMRVRRDPEA